MPTLTRIAPELPVANLAQSIAYYEAKLGFQTALTMPERNYAVVERDKVAIHLFQTAEGKTGSLHVFTEGVDELYTELKGRGARITQPVTLKPWGARDFRVLDDSGNELKFTEPIA